MADLLRKENGGSKPRNAGGSGGGNWWLLSKTVVVIGAAQAAPLASFLTRQNEKEMGVWVWLLNLFRSTGRRGARGYCLCDLAGKKKTYTTGGVLLTARRKKEIEKGKRNHTQGTRSDEIMNIASLLLLLLILILFC